MKFNKALPTAFRFAVILCCASLLVSCREKGKPNGDDSSTVPVQGKVAYADSSSSSVRVFDQEGRVCIQQSNTSYEMTDLYEGSTKIPLLLKIKKTELCFADSVNKDKVYEITAHSVMDTKTIEWTTQFVATELLIKDNSLLAIHEGMDGEEDLLTRFSLQDGKEVFGCSYGELKVAVPNVKQKRFIGFTSQKATTHPVQGLKEENLFGLVRFGSSNAAINTLKVKLKRSAVAGKIPVYTPDMVLVPANANTTAIEDGKSLILMKADEHFTSKDVTDFAVKFTFFYGDDNEATDIIIPIVSDQLDLSKAKFDKDIFEITAP